MNNKYFTIILIVFGLILLGIFTAWLLVSRGYVDLSSSNNADSETPPIATSVFPTGNDSGSSDGQTSFTTNTNANASSSILISGGQLDKLLSKLDTGAIGSLLTIRNNPSTIVFFERATGHLFQIPPSGSPFRVSNTTLPKLVTAWGGSNGSTTNFIIRTNSGSIETKMASLAKTASSSATLFLGTEDEIGGAPQELTIKPINTTALDFAVSPAGNQIAYLEKNNQGSDLIVSDWAGSKREKVASFPLTQLGLEWPATTTIAVSTKANYASDGLLYFYDLRTKKLDKIMSGVKGLSAKVSPDARYVLYSGNGGNTPFAALYDRRTSKIDRLPFSTLAEKCVWSSGSDLIYCGAPAAAPAGNYPDNWYQGTIALADNLWELEVSTKKATLLFNPELNNLGETIDVTEPVLDEDSKQLYFVNKNDFSLWHLVVGTGF